MERYHIYKLGLAILFYAVYCARQTVVNGLKIDDVTSTTNTTDYRERRDSGDDNGFFYQGADGKPGVDFPTLSYVPRTKFSCREMEAGYYADLEADCQVFHICDEGRKLSFLCPNGTVFQQAELICDWWFKVNCTTSPFLYEESAEILHKETAKRKESRRHGTKQGVFSSREDGDYQPNSFRVTPAHLVTSSYPYKSSFKTGDNRISASTEPSTRRTYNARDDRTLESFGNGVREKSFDKVNQFGAERSQSTFGANFQGTSSSGKVVTSTSTQRESSGREGGFGVNYSGQSGHRPFSSSTSTQQNVNTAGTISFDRNSQQTTGRRDPNIFGDSTQGKQTGFGQNSFGLRKQEAAGQATFSTTRNEKSNQIGFDTDSQKTGAGRGQNKFESRSQGEIGQNTYDANLQGQSDRRGKLAFSSSTQQIPYDRSVKPSANGRGRNTFDIGLQAKADDGSNFGANLKEKTGGFGEATFGANARQKFGNTGEISLERSSERTTFGGRNQGTFSTNLQGFGQTGFDANVRGESTGQKQATFGTGARQQNRVEKITFGTAMHKTSGTQGQNLFSSNLQGILENQSQALNDTKESLKVTGQEQFKFDSQGKPGSNQFNVFSSSSGQTTSGARLDDGHAIQGSFGSQGKPGRNQFNIFSSSSKQGTGDVRLDSGHNTQGSFGSQGKPGSNQFNVFSSSTGKTTSGARSDNGHDTQGSFGSEVKPGSNQFNVFSSSSGQTTSGARLDDGHAIQGSFGSQVKPGKNQFNVFSSSSTQGTSDVRLNSGHATQGSFGSQGKPGSYQFNVFSSSSGQTTSGTRSDNGHDTQGSFGSQEKPGSNQFNVFSLSSGQTTSGARLSDGHDTQGSFGSQVKLGGNQFNVFSSSSKQGTSDVRLDSGHVTQGSFGSQGKPGSNQFNVFSSSSGQTTSGARLGDGHDTQGSFGSQVKLGGNQINIFSSSSKQGTSDERLDSGHATQGSIGLQGKPGSNQFNVFSSSSGQTTSGVRSDNGHDTQGSLKSADQEQIKFGSQGKPGSSHFSVFGSSSGQTTSGTRIDNGQEKIKFSISSQGKSDEFSTGKQQESSGYQQNAFGSNGDAQGISYEQTTSGRGLHGLGGSSKNRLDVTLREQFDQTTSKFGLKSTQSFGSHGAGDNRGIVNNFGSAETQEPQETASFVMGSRNNLQSTTNLYPNHRQTYSDIKNPRLYYEKSQSQLPEKPFYGSSVSPQVLSTVPVSPRDGSFRPTTEISPQTKSPGFNFGFKTDVSTTKQPSFDSETTTFRGSSYIPSSSPIEKSSVTTSKFSFGLQAPLPKSKTDASLESSGTTGNYFDGKLTGTVSYENVEDTTLGQGVGNFGLKSGYSTEKIGTFGVNKGDVSSYDESTDVDVRFNSVSSTLSPDVSGDISGKLTASPGSQKNKYSDEKLSTPAVGINNFGFGGYRTTEKPYTDSPIIKLNIIPSTSSPSFESEDRTGKSFSLESPKTQILSAQDSKTHSCRKCKGERTESTLGVTLGSGDKGFRGSQTIFATTPRNGFGAITGVALSTSSDIIGFGGNNYNSLSASTPSTIQKQDSYTYQRKPTVETSRVEFGINKEAQGTIASVGGGSLNLNINNQSPSFSVVTGKTGLDITNPTQTTPIETDTVEVTINDLLFTSLPPESKQTINLRINEQNYSAPTTIFSVGRHGEAGAATTEATPSRDESTSNIIYTSTSNILQPKPFSFSTGASISGRIGVTEETLKAKQPEEPQLPPYKISSASPFATTENQGSGLESKTLTPTQPTPYTTAATLLDAYQPKDENFNNILSLMEIVRQRLAEGSSNDNGFGTPRPGLVVPPSAGPQTLHSLAIYFANALDNLTSSSPREQSERTDSESETDSPIIHIDNEELIKSLLTQMTLNNYDDLFKEDATTTEVPLSQRTNVDDSENDLDREDTKHPATEGPGVRQLARVFTEALSAYLEDPDTFKKVLHAVRPTEPSPTLSSNETAEIDDDEVLNYSDSDLKSDHPHLPTRPTGIPISPTWGYILAYNNKSSSSGSDNNNLESRNSIGSENENLQSADSQSFVSQLNKVTRQFKTTVASDLLAGTTEASDLDDLIEGTGKTLPEDHWTTSSDVAKLLQTALLINPAAVNENFDSTQDFTLSDGAKNSEESSSESAGRATISEIQYELRALPKLKLNSTQVHGILIDFMNATKTEGSAKLQRLLQKLNISQDEFLTKMKEIEENPLTRRLILLLISECNTDNNKELETKVTSADSVFGLAQSRFGDSELPGTTAKYGDSQTDGDVTTESNSYKRLVHPSLDEEDEDTRALELLNSLYVIASKFGK